MDHARKNRGITLLVLVALCTLAIISATGENNTGTTNNTSTAITPEVPIASAIDQPTNTIQEGTSTATPSEATQPQIQPESTTPDATVSRPQQDITTTIQNHQGKLTARTEAILNASLPDDEQRVIIRYQRGFDKTTTARFTDKKDLGGLRVQAFTAKTKDVASLLDDDHIALLELDQPITVMSETIPWGVNKTLAPTAWNTTTGTGITVAVLDTGIGPHNDLTIAGGTSVVSENYDDNNGHGTMVAGVIAASQNDEGIIGVSPTSNLYAVKIMNDSTGTLSDAINGIEWAVDHNMSIILMSWSTQAYSQILKETLQDAHDHGILLIAASGNAGPIQYPAAYDTVISVGSIDENNQPAGSTGPEQELVAPGTNTLTTSIDGGYTTVNGSSVAAPHTAGVAALIWAHNQTMTNDDVRATLRNNALDLGNPGRDDDYGYGLVQAILDSTNTTLEPTTYYYEVFNITNYGQQAQTVTFWTNGTGTIDDLTLAPGYYLVTEYRTPTINQTLYVNENGTITTLTPSFYLTWTSDYTLDTGSGDATVWENGALSFRYDETPLADVVCFDDEYISGFTYWKCRGQTSTKLIDCSTAHSALGTFCSTGDCSETGINDWYSIPSANLQYDARKQFGIRRYFNCTGAIAIINETTPYTIVDQKTTAYSTSTSYKIKGRYDTGADLWMDIGLFTCGAQQVCDLSIAGDYNTSVKDYSFHNQSNSHHPCRIPNGGTCNETDTNYSNNCQTGSICSNGICLQANSTDLAVVSVVPIQVLPYTKMVKSKSGFVVVEVVNNGPSTATAEVGLTLDGAPLRITQKSIPAANNGSYWYNSSYITNTNTSALLVNHTAWFVFDFTPLSLGVNRTLNASVRIA